MEEWEWTVLCHTLCNKVNSVICCPAVAKSDTGEVANNACRVMMASRQFRASKVKDGFEDKRGRVE